MGRRSNGGETRNGIEPGDTDFFFVHQCCFYPIFARKVLDEFYNYTCGENDPSLFID